MIMGIKYNHKSKLEKVAVIILVCCRWVNQLS